MVKHNIINETNARATSRGLLETRKYKWKIIKKHNDPTIRTKVNQHGLMLKKMPGQVPWVLDIEYSM